MARLPGECPLTVHPIPVLFEPVGRARTDEQGPHRKVGGRAKEKIVPSGVCLVFVPFRKNWLRQNTAGRVRQTPENLPSWHIGFRSAVRLQVARRQSGPRKPVAE